MNSNVTIVGGGIVGLSIAYEMLSRGWQVTVIERGKFGREASWAGAGILLPANRLTANHPLEHLSALSNQLHGQWSESLLDETGIDNGFHQCGGLYIARTPGEVAALCGLEFQWNDEDIAIEVLTKDQIRELDFVQQNPDALLDVQRAIALKHESQVCNPHHLDALVKACKLRGASMFENTAVAEVNRSSSSRRITQVVTESGTRFESDTFVFAAGAWSQQTLDFIKLPMVPIRGQVIMFKLPTQIFAPIIYEGSHYLVPRRDGHVLAGATVEEVGFDRSNTPQAIEMLQQFANRQFPQLNPTTQIKQWAGLRPATFDGFPYLGPLVDLDNAFVAAGHFRLGLQLSTGTAQVLGDLIEHGQSQIDLAPLSPSRVV